jgi:hypothetical protein
MIDTISPDIQASFDFVRDRHLAQSPVNYEVLRTVSDWRAAATIEISVANGIMRWIAQQPDSVRRALVADLFASRVEIATWEAFKARLWIAMDAAAWVRRWDCWTHESDLWQAALGYVYHTFALYFYPSEWS